MSKELVSISNSKKPDPLFDNPMVQQIRDEMTPEEREKYDKIGKEMYEQINFETGTIEGEIDDVLAQLKGMLQSGIHPSDLTYEEKIFSNTTWEKNGFVNLAILKTIYVVSIFKLKKNKKIFLFIKMVYYLSSGRNYGLSDMSLANLKQAKVGPVSALVFLVGVPLAVLLLSIVVGMSTKLGCMCDEQKDGTRVVNKVKVMGWSVLLAAIAGGVAYAVVKNKEDA